MSDATSPRNIAALLVEFWSPRVIGEVKTLSDASAYVQAVSAIATAISGSGENRRTSRQERRALWKRGDAGLRSGPRQFASPGSPTFQDRSR